MRILLLLALVASVAPCVARASDIHQAVRARDMHTLTELLNRGDSDAVNETERGGVTALHIAAATDQDEAAVALLQRGANVNAKTLSGFCPLHWCASRDAVTTAATLIEKGADINAIARNGITPLHWAANKAATNVLHLLIQCGADLEARTDTQQTPLHMAIRENKHGHAAVMLAEAMVDSQMGDEPTEALLPDPDEAENDDLPPPEEDPNMMRAEPGTFLSVPLGMGETLSFVWVEELGIWFGKYEVTNGEYKRFKRTHCSRSYQGFNLDESRQPVCYVSWNEAEAFCKWLNERYNARIPLQCEFRLPTGREWSFVASHDDDRIYPWGDEWPPLYGNFSDMAAREHLAEWQGIRGYDDGHPVTCPVENSAMNESGVYGLAGNVSEWTMDWYDDEQQFKVRKGGSWDFDPRENLRITYRGLDRQTARYDTIGIRLVVANRR